MSSRDRLLNASAANAASLVARVAQQLMFVPILIIAWGPDLYGEWLVISAIPIYLSLSDFGFVLAGSNELARRATFKNDLSKFYDNYSIVIQRFSLTIVFLLLLCAYWIPLKDIMGLETLTPDDTSLIFLALSLQALIQQNSLKLLAGLRAKGKIHIGLWIRVASTLSQAGLALIMIIIFKVSPANLALGMLLMSLFYYWVEWGALRKAGLQQRKHFYQELDKEIPLAPYMYMGLEMMLMPLAQALTLQGAIILISKVLDPVSVAIFATHRTLARISTAVLHVFSNPLMSEAGLLQRPEDKEKLTKIVGVLSRVTLWMALVVSVNLALLGGWIYSFWTNGELNYRLDIFALMLLGVVLESLWRIPTAVRLGSNRHRPIAWGYFISSVIGLVVASLLAAELGLLGVAMGISLIDILMVVVSISTLRSVLDVSIRDYILGLSKPPLLEIRQLTGKILSRALA